MDPEESPQGHAEMRRGPGVVTSARSPQVDDCRHKQPYRAQCPGSSTHHIWVRPRTLCPTPKGVQQQITGQDWKNKALLLPQSSAIWFENQGHPEPMMIYWWWMILHTIIYPHICSILLFHSQSLSLPKLTTTLQNSEYFVIFLHIFFMPLFRNL